MANLIAIYYIATYIMTNVLQYSLHSCMHIDVHPAPSAPRNVTLQDINSTYAIIGWIEPEFPNGVVRRYILTLTNADDDGTERNITTDELSVNVTGLVPFTEYWIVVFAETVAVGDGSSNISIRTPQDSKQKSNQ